MITAAITVGTVGLAVGVKNVIEGAFKNDQAYDVSDRANHLRFLSIKRGEWSRKKAGESIENLGRKKIEVLSDSLSEFVHEYEKINRIIVSDRGSSDESEGLLLSEVTIHKMHEMSNLAGAVSGGLAGGAATGALTAVGAYSIAATFGVASTGTPIVELAGIAAKNATLCVLGGGTILSGGGGISLGLAGLSSLVVGPAAAVLGIVMEAEASSNLSRSRTNLARATEEMESTKLIYTLCVNIAKKADILARALDRQSKLLKDATKKLAEVVALYGTNYQSYDIESRKKVAQAAAMASLLKTMVDIPVLNEDGTLTDEICLEVDKLEQDGIAYIETSKDSFPKETLQNISVVDGISNSSIMHKSAANMESKSISKGNCSQRYENCAITVKGTVHIQNKLTFDHCIISFSDDKKDQIVLDDGAELVIQSSDIIEKHKRNNEDFDRNRYFIEGIDKNSITISHCSFSMCEQFMHTKNSKDIYVADSVFENCASDLAYCSYTGADGSYVIEDCTIISNDISYAFNHDLGTRCSMFTRSGYFKEPTNKPVVRNVRVYEGENFRREYEYKKTITQYKETKKGDNSALYYFSIDWGELSDSYFYGASRCFMGLVIHNCSFEKCNKIKNTISSSNKYMIRLNNPDMICAPSMPILDTCRFVECDNILESEEGCLITNCHFESADTILRLSDSSWVMDSEFINCRGLLINAEYGGKGGVEVDNCKFNKIVNDYYDAEEPFPERKASICFKVDETMDFVTNHILNCAFEDVSLKKASLIGCFGNDVPKSKGLIVKNCFFRNISKKSYISKGFNYGRKKRCITVSVLDCTRDDK